MKSTCIKLTLLTAIATLSLLFTGCARSHPVAAGAAGAAVYNQHQENQRQEDINKVKDARNR